MVAIDKNIDVRTAASLNYLIREYQNAEYVGNEVVGVKKREITQKCPSCGYTCPELVYDGGNFGPIITHMSCDCGYTIVFNYGGMVFEQSPHVCKPYIWNRHDVGSYKARIKNPIPGEQALKILETKLVKI